MRNKEDDAANCDGGRDPESDRREVAPEQDLASLVQSNDWLSAMIAVRRAAWRMCPRRLLDDVVAEAQFRLLAYAARGNRVRSWEGLATQVVKSAARWLHQQELCALQEPESLTTGAFRSNQGCAEGAVVGAVCALRGRTQKRLVVMVMRGLNLGEIATELHQPEFEVRRKVTDLAKLINDRTR